MLPVWRPDTDIWCLLQLDPALIADTEFLTNPGDYKFCYTGWQASLRHPLVFLCWDHRCYQHPWLCRWELEI